MPRPEKVQAVEDIKARLSTSEAAFLTEYRGLTVAQQQDLRRRLRAAASDYSVVKMTLARRAVEALGLAELNPWLNGPTAIAFATEDPIRTARTLRDFSVQNDRLVLKAGLLAGRFIDPAQVMTLAQIESREVLLARMAGAGKAPLGQMLGLLSALLRNAVSMFRQLAERESAPEPQQAEEAEVPQEAMPEAMELEAQAEPEVQESAARTAEEPRGEEALAEEPAARAEPEAGTVATEAPANESPEEE